MYSASLDYNGNYFIVDLVEKKINLTGNVKGEAQKIRPLNKKENAFLILVKNSLHLFEAGNFVKKVDLPKDCVCMDVNEHNDEIYIGDCV